MDAVLFVFRLPFSPLFLLQLLAFIYDFNHVNAQWGDWTPEPSCDVNTGKYYDLGDYDADDDRYYQLRGKNFGSSVSRGCIPNVPHVDKCCSLVWEEEADAWVYFHGTINGTRAVAGDCCLYRFEQDHKEGISHPNATSGYKSYRCMLAGDCDIHLLTINANTGNRFQYGTVEPDAIMLINQEDECGEVSYANQPIWYRMQDVFQAFECIGDVCYNEDYTSRYDHLGDGDYKTFEGAVYKFGTKFKTNNAPPGDYNICYAFRPINLLIGFIDFRYHGTLSISGPYLNQYHTCMLGEVACAVNMTGYRMVPDIQSPPQRIATTAQIILIQTISSCGDVNPLIIEFPGIANPKAITDDHLDSNFAMGAAQAGPVNTNFTICWAADCGMYADNACPPEDYVLELGKFYMKGPEQCCDNTCIMTEDCDIAITGDGTDEFDGLLIVEGADITCGRMSMFAADIGRDHARIPTPVEQYNPWQLFKIGQISKASMFNQVGPAYSICWSGAENDIDLFTDFKLDTELNKTISEVEPRLVNFNVKLGVLTLRGPNLLLSTGEPMNGEGWYCWFTKPCTIDVTGYQIPHEANIFLVDQDYGHRCGVFDADNHAIGNYTDVFKGSHGSQVHPDPMQNPGYGMRYNNPGVPSSAMSYDFGIPGQGTPKRDRYLACWSSRNSLTAVDQYKTPLSNLVLGGPHYEPVGTYVCMVGYECSFMIRGIELHPTNRILFGSDTMYCGEKDAILGGFDHEFDGSPLPIMSFYEEQLAMEKALPNYMSYDNTTVTALNFTFGRISRGGGLENWRVCWAKDAGSEAATPYSESFRFNYPTIGDHSEFLFQFATIRMQGPYWGYPYCWMGLPCTIEIPGVDLADTNAIHIIKPTVNNVTRWCGEGDTHAIDFSGTMIEYKKVDNNGLNHHTYTMGTPEVPSEVGSFFLCWADNLFGGHESDPLRFRHTSGYFELRGPKNIDMEFVCALSVRCNLDMEGHMFSTDNGLMIIESHDADGNEKFCGEADVEPVNWLGITNPTYGSGEDNRFFDFDVVRDGLQGELYKLCFAALPDKITLNKAEYNVFVGPMALAGIDRIDLVTCALGELCTLNTTGILLQSSNAFAIIEDDTECGAHNATLANFTGMENPNVVDGPYSRYHDFRTPILGNPGMYKLCFGWARASSGLDLTLYSYQVAPFKMQGPFQERKTCTMSEPCDVALTGTDLMPSNAIIWIDRKTHCGDPDTHLYMMPGIESPYRSKLQVPNATVDVHEPGTPGGGLPGVNARICWSAHPEDLNDVTKYLVDLGLFTLLGPNQKIFRLLTDTIVHYRDNSGRYFFEAQTWVNEYVKLGSEEYDGYIIYRVMNSLSPYFRYGLFEHSKYAEDIPAGGVRFTGPTRLPKDDQHWFEIRDENAANCPASEPCNLVLESYKIDYITQTPSLYAIHARQDCLDTVNDFVHTVDKVTYQGAMPTGLLNPSSFTQGVDVPGKDGEWSYTYYHMGTVTNAGLAVDCCQLIPGTLCLGDHYKLCWASGGLSSGNAAHKHATQVAQFKITGLYEYRDGELGCNMGQKCELEVCGAGLNAVTNRVAMIYNDKECGEDGGQLVSWPGIDNPSQFGKSSLDQQRTVYQLGIASEGSLSQSKLCFGSNPSILKEYGLAAGNFQMTVHRLDPRNITGFSGKEL